MNAKRRANIFSHGAGANCKRGTESHAHRNCRSSLLRPAHQEFQCGSGDRDTCLYEGDDRGSQPCFSQASEIGQFAGDRTKRGLMQEAVELGAVPGRVTAGPSFAVSPRPNGCQNVIHGM